MPRMNGMGAIQEIKKQCPSTKILVLTVHKTEEYILATLKAGADGYVLKDATHSELMLAIEHIFSRKELSQPRNFRKGDRGIPGRKENDQIIDFLGYPDPAGARDSQNDS